MSFRFFVRETIIIITIKYVSDVTSVLLSWLTWI